MTDILHIATPSAGRYGGVGTCVVNLLSSFHGSPYTHSLVVPFPSSNCDIDFVEKNIPLNTYPDDGVTPLHLSLNFKKLIAFQQAKLYHLNGLWQYPQHYAAKFARRKGLPYIITPHGMLYPEALKISRIKKRIILDCWFKKDIMDASCIQVTCETEMHHLRAFGYKGPVAVIGNPVSVPSYVNSVYRDKKGAIPAKTKERSIKIGLLARLHPIKGIESLIKATAMTKVGQLVLMGAGDEEYTAKLHSLVDSLGISNRVEFAGFVNGEEKFRRLAGLDALFVPSDMENFGMIVPEALLVGTPVMASTGTPWQELEERGCGWWRDNSPGEIAKVIDEVGRKSPRELFEMGSRGREMVLEKYEASKVADRMIRLYRWLLGEADKPEFVYLG